MIQCCIGCTLRSSSPSRRAWRLCAPAYFLVASSRVQFKVLVDAKGSVAFCLDAEAEPGTPAGTPRGTITCSGYLPIFSCLDAAEGLATWIELLLGAACPECRQWSADEWRKRRERYDAEAAAFEAHTAHLF